MLLAKLCVCMSLCLYLYSSLHFQEYTTYMVHGIPMIWISDTCSPAYIGADFVGCHHDDNHCQCRHLYHHRQHHAVSEVPCCPFQFQYSSSKVFNGHPGFVFPAVWWFIIVCESLNLSIGYIHGVSIYFCTCWFICKTGCAFKLFQNILISFVIQQHVLCNFLFKMPPLLLRFIMWLIHLVSKFHCHRVGWRLLIFWGLYVEIPSSYGNYICEPWIFQ